MKPVVTAIVFLASMPLVAFAEGEWTHHAEEGEDATSTHYYFYESNGDSVQRVRWIWNGGAQNPPTVTEYLLGSGQITIRHLEGKRADLQELVSGRDAELVTRKEYSIIARSTAEMLLPTPPAQSLSDTERIDIKNLIDLLAIDRKPINLKAQPGAGDQTAKPVVNDLRPPGGDGSMFFKVFVSRNDTDGDGVIQKSEFRGGGARFDQMDTNKNGKLDRAEVDALHRSRMADPLSMRERIARGETRRPPVDLPAEPGHEPGAGDETGPDGEPSALTPLGTRITAQQAYARLDVDKNGKVTASEFQKSPGMMDPEMAEQTVAGIDGDGDGSLSFSEFNAVFARRHAKQAPAKAEPEPAQPSPK